MWLPNKWQMKYYGNFANMQPVTLSIGDDLVVHYGNKCMPNCRFIKTTRKGFNILNLDTDRCVLKRPVYAKGMGHKDFPASGPIKGTFYISKFFTIYVKEKNHEKAG